MGCLPKIPIGEGENLLLHYEINNCDCYPSNSVLVKSRHFCQCTQASASSKLPPDCLLKRRRRLFALTVDQRASEQVEMQSCLMG